MRMKNITNRIIQHIRKHKFKSICFRKCGDNQILGDNLTFWHPEYISLGNHIFFDDNCSLKTWPEYRGKKCLYHPEMVIHDNVSMMRNCYISCMNKIEIGSGCLLGDNVYVSDNFHGRINKDEIKVLPIERELYSKGPVFIGKNVWIGRNVCIMPGVTIGDGAIIGANSVVTKDIESNTVVAGCPASFIRKI